MLDRGQATSADGFDDGVIFGDSVVVEAGASLIPPRLLFGGPDKDLVIRDDVVVGAGALVAGATLIGKGARIQPGAVVTRDVPPYAIVSGNPATVVGYAAPIGPDRVSSVPIHFVPPALPGFLKLVGGASLHRFPEANDLRGNLSFAQVGDHLPFVIQRFFCVYGVPSSEIRGEHAHRTLHELLVCVSGGLRVSLTDGKDRHEVVLDEPGVGLYLPPLVWSTQFQQSPTTVLMVMCSEPYDPGSYIRDYDEYLEIVK